MGLLSALNVGVMGMQAVGDGMTVTGDNIANAGTVGFKSSRAEFQDVLASSLKGIEGGDQIGAGTRLAHVSSLFNQGTVARTDNITDLAVNGNGFFQVNAPFGKGFTRDGQLHFDKEGFLVTGDGYKVDGYKVDDDGKVMNQIEPIKLGNPNIPAKGTKGVDVMMNLDSREEVKAFNIEDPIKTSSYNSTMTVYDNVGTARLITLYFNKTANNTWDYHAVVDGKDAAGGVEGKGVEMAKGQLTFNDKGLLSEVKPGTNSFNFNKGAAPGQVIDLRFGKTIKEGGTGLEASSQYGSKTAISRHTQDGNSAGVLTSMSFDDDGILTAVYDNGMSRAISQLGLAKFESNEGLFKTGKNLFKESRKSGQAIFGKPGDTGRGVILSKSIELSNVDIATEFVNLMNSQRGFTANSKTVATTDQMLQEVLNLKR